MAGSDTRAVSEPKVVASVAYFVAREISIRCKFQRKREDAMGSSEVFLPIAKFLLLVGPELDKAVCVHIRYPLFGRN